MTKKKKRTFAAIHLGSESISLQVVEFSELQDIRVIDETSRRVTLGEETFKHGRLSFQTVRDICELLRGYKRLLAEYQVTDYRLLATTAIREATNQQYIIDQIQVRTGFQVEVIDMPQEIYMKYAAIQRSMQAQQVVHRQDSVLLVDISSGGLSITLWENSAIRYQQNIHLGLIRVREVFEPQERASSRFPQALTEYIHSTISPVRNALAGGTPRYLVITGSETKLVLKMLGRNVQERRLEQISRAAFESLFENVRLLKAPQLTKIFAIDEAAAELVLPTLTLYQELLLLSQVEQILVPYDRFLDGVVYLQVAEETEDPWLKTLEEEVIGLARSLGVKYSYDAAHARQTEVFALQLFDKLKRLQGLRERDRFLLRVLCMLHDIGKFVCLRRHYFYSYRLIVSSDILGLSDEEKEVVAIAAYSHARGVPDQEDVPYHRLDRSRKVLVAKLGAILALADAMDRSYRQKIDSCVITQKGDELHISVSARQDISLEAWTFAGKAEFFADVFGLHPVLERKA